MRLTCSHCHSDRRNDTYGSLCEDCWVESSVGYDKSEFSLHFNDRRGKVTWSQGWVALLPPSKPFWDK
jgi:hypothetical protein